MTRASRSEERWQGPGPRSLRAFAPPFPGPRATESHSDYAIQSPVYACWIHGEPIVSKSRSWTLVALMKGGNSHLVLRMVKEGKWMCEKILKVFLSLRKWIKNRCGPILLIKLSLKEEEYLWREHTWRWDHQLRVRRSVSKSFHERKQGTIARLCKQEQS